MRRRPAGESSLELLLDTICNTFGGVLFIAMLVAVLVQNSSLAPSAAPDPGPSAAELIAGQSELADLLDRLAALRAAAAQQSELLRQFAMPENTALLDELKSVTAQRDALLDRRLRLVEAAAERQVRIDQIAEELRQLDTRLKQVGDELTEAEAALRSEIAARTQSARLPRLRNTFKQEIGIIVRYGRLYLWHRYGPSGVREGLNTDEFVVLGPTSRGIRTTPKPYAGVPIAGDETARAAIRGRLARFDPAWAYLAVVVWDDSFAHFQDLKTVLIDASFEYRLMPLIEGESIYDRGGPGGRVQ